MKTQREAIKEWVLARDTFTLHELAKEMGTTTDDMDFMLTWHKVQKEDLVGIATVVSRGSGKKYEVRRGDPGAVAAARQAQQAQTKAMRGVERAHNQAAMAPLMTSDERLLAALKRREERCELLAATIGRVRLQRKFD